MKSCRWRSRASGDRHQISMETEAQKNWTVITNIPPFFFTKYLLIVHFHAIINDKKNHWNYTSLLSVITQCFVSLEQNKSWSVLYPILLIRLSCCLSDVTEFLPVLVTTSAALLSSSSPYYKRNWSYWKSFSCKPFFLKLQVKPPLALTQEYKCCHFKPVYQPKYSFVPWPT